MYIDVPKEDSDMECVTERGLLRVDKGLLWQLPIKVGQEQEKIWKVIDFYIFLVSEECLKFYVSIWSKTNYFVFASRFWT